jgi:mRNA-degrading endonuclease RelE of RelBE toxin-antitoxin system
MGLMPYEILIHETAAEEIEKLRSYDQRAVMDGIEEHLSHQPQVRTRCRKCLESLTPRFEHVLPVWELRVGSFRVFYDVDEAENQVHVRAVRHKGQTQTTEDIT